MSATNFIDDVLENSGEYAVYGKALGDKMRKDVQYGKNPWEGGQNALPGISGVDDSLSSRAARIAELERELAEIRKQKAAFSDEAEMGRYKFQFDSDPSAYMNYRQSMRNAEQTDRIAKRNEENTKQANLKSLMDNLTLKREEAYWNNRGYANKFKYAEQENNPQAMEEALLGLQKTQADLDKYDSDLAKVQPRIARAAGIDDLGKDVQPSRSFEEEEAKVANASVLKQLKEDYERTAPAIKVDNVPISKEQKVENIARWRGDIDRWRAQVANSAFGPDQKKEILKQLDQMARDVDQYEKPANKGGQATIPTQDEVSALSYQQLKDMGYDWLTYVQRLGLKHPSLNKAIALTRKGKK